MHPETKPKRCAVYTRKSTEEGLEMDFNSLHAQREACEAYITSQRHEGWRLIPAAYDDGGISGGTMERPGLQQLLTDIRAKKVDVIVVYKVDRLTRSLADFAKMVEVFDGHGVSFVAVTQQFNTTTSMGRLTLNVLLSFAQFEREVTGERIRDKIAASKAKGIWMGGGVPRGYRVEDRKLLVVPDDAAVVRRIYELYQASTSIRDLWLTLKKQGIRSRATKDGLGAWMSRGAIYALLKSPIYAGLISHKGKLYPGQHEALIDRQLWDATQAKLNGAARNRGPHRKNELSLLMGKLFDQEGRLLTPSYTQKGGRRYRYYESHSNDRDERAYKQQQVGNWRLRAADIESRVRDIAVRMLGDRAAVATAAIAAGLESHEAYNLSTTVGGQGIECVRRVQLFSDRLHVTLELSAHVPITFLQEVAMTLQQRGVERRIVIPGLSDADAKPDLQLLKLIGRSMRFWERLTSNGSSNATTFAKEEGVHSSDLSRVLPLAFLSPEFVTAIACGKHRMDWTSHRLLRLESIPLRWSQQRSALKF